MRADFESLHATNIRIGEAESAGEQDFFKSLLAPSFSFRRASGDIVDRQAFIDKVSRSARRETRIESISILGRDRALVTCVVTMEVDGKGASFHNVRLFVRRPGEDWQFLAWANEPMGS